MTHIHPSIPGFQPRSSLSSSCELHLIGYLSGFCRTHTMAEPSGESIPIVWPAYARFR